MDFVNLPPWAQTLLTIIGVLSVLLPIVGRLIGPTWPGAGAKLMAAGNDLRGVQEVARTGVYAPKPLSEVQAQQVFLLVASGKLTPEEGAEILTGARAMPEEAKQDPERTPTTSPRGDA